MSTNQIVGAIELGIGIATGNPNLIILGGATMMAAPPPNQQGPRLGDLKVQSSAYGNPIPVVYGMMRAAGNLIWSTPIVETPNETSAGGKGDGPTTTNYSYSQSFAIALCEGEIAGIGKIWANGKLIYNLSASADVETVLASESFAASIRVYTGTETQVADALIEADVGIADAPAYRGIAYVVFENLQLADFGNRAPNLEFEVMQSATLSGLGDSGLVIDSATVGGISTGTHYIASSKEILLTPNSGTTLRKFDIYTGSKTELVVGTAPSYAQCIVEDELWSTVSAWYQMMRTNVITGAQSVFSYPGVQVQCIAFGGGYIWSTYNGTLYRTNITTNTTSSAFSLPFTSVGKMLYESHTGSLWISYGNSVTYGVMRIQLAGGSIIGAQIFSCGPQPGAMVFDTVNNAVWVLSETGSRVDKLDSTTGAILATYSVAYLASSICFDGAAVWVGGGYSSALARRIDVVTGAVTYQQYGYAIYSIVYDANKGVWGTDTLSNLVKLKTYNSIIPSDVTVSSVTTDICTRAGLTAGQLNVTALSDTVTGYLVQRSTARAQLGQLMQAFYFDAVESDGKVKFVKRGGASVVSIPEDDLAAHAYGATPPDNLLTERKQEMELPVDFSVEYLDANAGYQIGTQTSQRLTSSSKNVASIKLAMAITASKAKQISDVLMYDAWTSRTTFMQAHGWKYSYLEPTDIITVTKDGRSHVMRIVDEDASGGIYSRKAVLEDTVVYTQTAVAAGLQVPDETVATIPQTKMLLLDIPLLRDQDDGVGFYAAACGYGSGWKGAQAYKSNDSGATWGLFGAAFLNAASIGSAITALGEFAQNIFDETNSVTVRMLNGTLSSDTELNVLNGANVALLGDEIIQFRTATLVAAGTYTLTGLLRGRRGTEWATSTHAISDRFVLLSTSTINLFTGVSSEYDLSRKYKGASFGGFLDDAYAIDFTNTAVSLIPYSPVQLGGGRDASSNITINWVRRTRIVGGWNSYADVPLGETSQAYEVDIYADGSYATVLRTISAATQTASYTAAQQTTDFGSAQSTVYFGVFQLSAAVGRGYEARGIL